MASGSRLPAIDKAEATGLIRQVQHAQLFNRQLSYVCQENGLKSTGVKIELQSRITNHIQEILRTDDIARFRKVQQTIASAINQERPGSTKAASTSHNHSAAGSFAHGYQPTARPVYDMPSQRYSNGFYSSGMQNGNQQGPHRAPATIPFKPNPFYEIERPIGSFRTCEIMAQHRNSIMIPIKLEETTCQRLASDKALRIMIFCAAETQQPQDVAFPHQSEIKVNSEEIKANLRGLKGKPGSTRPVDITHMLRLRPANYSNMIEFTYALTSKKFYIAVNMCRSASIEKMVDNISTRRRIPRQSVISELNRKAQDPDVVATSQVLSLRCPLSYMRLVVPCRGLACTHIQCFDATSYLQLQEQGPQWLCPICSKSAPFDQLAIDEYVKDILAKTPTSLETVTIEPDGQWFTRSAADDGPGKGELPLALKAEGDDELEISEYSFIGGGRHNMTPPNPTPHPSVSTPATASTAAIRSSVPGSGPLGQGSASSKRPAPVVIDLTLSSDDEEPVARPRKRQRGFAGTIDLESELPQPPTGPQSFPLSLYGSSNSGYAHGMNPFYQS